MRSLFAPFVAAAGSRLSNASASGPQGPSLKSKIGSSAGRLRVGERTTRRESHWLKISEQFPQPGNGVVYERANRAIVARALREQYETDRNWLRFVRLEERNQGTLRDLLLDLIRQGANNSQSPYSGVDRCTCTVRSQSAGNPNRFDAASRWTLAITPQFLGPGLVQPDAQVVHKVRGPFR